MTCEELQDLLIAHAANELAPAQQEFVQMHVDQCGRCQAALADLSLTRRQLQVLREERWQPELSERINRSIGRQAALLKATRWAQRAVAVAAVVGVAAFGLSHLPGAPTPAAPAVLERGGMLYQGVQPYEGKVLAHSPDGRFIYLLRHPNGEEFAIDRVEAATGRLIRDESPEPGQIGSKAAISTGGQTLYVLGKVGTTTYLKLINTRDLKVSGFFPLGDFPADGRPFLVKDGKAVTIVGQGRIVQIDLKQKEAKAILCDYRVAGLTSDAVLSPEGKRLVVALSTGGLIAYDADQVSTLTRAEGPVYTALAWDGRLTAATAGQTVTIDPLTLIPTN